jgi:hypothetical protein
MTIFGKYFQMSLKFARLGPKISQMRLYEFKKICVEWNFNLGNCNIHMKQNFSVINKMKWDKISVKPKV